MLCCSPSESGDAVLLQGVKVYSCDSMLTGAELNAVRSLARPHVLQAHDDWAFYCAEGPVSMGKGSSCYAAEHGFGQFTAKQQQHNVFVRQDQCAFQKLRNNAVHRICKPCSQVLDTSWF